MQTHLIRAIQLIFIPFFWIVNGLLIKKRRMSLSMTDIKPGVRYIVVANHTGVPDPFIICYSLSLKLNFKLTPWRFFVENRYFKNPLFLPVLYGLGCFPARKDIGKKSGLEHGLHLLAKNQNLVIFPEGKISRFDARTLPKTGVEVLASQNKTLLIPARVRWQRRWWVLQTYSLRIGKPFSGKNMTAGQIMDVVYSLKFS